MSDTCRKYPLQKQNIQSHGSQPWERNLNGYNNTELWNMLSFHHIHDGVIVTTSQLKLFVLEIRLHHGLFGQGKTTAKPHTSYACQMCGDERIKLLKKSILIKEFSKRSNYLLFSYLVCGQFLQEMNITACNKYFLRLTPSTCKNLGYWRLRRGIWNTCWYWETCIMLDRLRKAQLNPHNVQVMQWACLDCSSGVLLDEGGWQWIGHL